MGLYTQQQYGSIKYGILWIAELQNPNFKNLPRREQEGIIVKLIEKLHDDVLNLLSVYG